MKTIYTKSIDKTGAASGYDNSLVAQRNERAVPSFKLAKTVGAESVTAEQLERINLFTRRELSSDEVYIFSVILCDNEIDRDGEQFPEESLEILGELFIGKTGVFDHNPRAENQSARIFETGLLREERLNSLGEPYCCLKAWAYMVRCDKNADLILEIDAGIKKEVSVGCAVERIICSVCGADQKTSACGHQKGREYDGRPCCHRLVNPTDAYEWSFVAVPAQKNAGVTKKNKTLKGDGILNLSKLFEADGDVTLCKSDLAVLKNQYAELEKLARAGEDYIKSLRRDVVRLPALAQPELSSPVMESVTKKLDSAELLELKRAFGKSAAKAYPIAPQLCGAETPSDSPVSQFKI